MRDERKGLGCLFLILGSQKGAGGVTFPYSRHFTHNAQRLMDPHIYIVEDHGVMRRALGEFISNETNLILEGAGESGEQALEELTPEVDLVLVDTRLPEMNGIALIEELKRLRPDLKCLMLSGHDEETYVEQALDAGACGYVVKGNPDEIPVAIQHVLNGEVYLSETLNVANSPEHQ